MGLRTLLKHSNKWVLAFHSAQVLYFSYRTGGRASLHRFMKQYFLWPCLDLVVPLCSFSLGVAFGKSELFSFAGTNWPHFSVIWGQKQCQHVHVVELMSSHSSLLCVRLCEGVIRLPWDSGGGWISCDVCISRCVHLWLTGLAHWPGSPPSSHCEILPSNVCSRSKLQYADQEGFNDFRWYVKNIEKIKCLIIF